MDQKPPVKGKLPKDALRRTGRELMEYLFGIPAMKEVDKVVAGESSTEGEK